MRNNNKFGAQKTEYAGEAYDSKAEADFAAELDLLKAARNPKERVERWERQVKYEVKVNGKKICDYFLDFRVWYTSGVIRNYDVKGYKGGAAYQLFRIKKKLVEATHGIYIDEV